MMAAPTRRLTRTHAAPGAAAPGIPSDPVKTLGYPLVNAGESSAPEPAVARDPATVALLLQGDPEGLRQLLLDHGGLIAARLRKDFRRILDDSELDEAMSAMAVNVWKAATRFDPQKGSLRAWASVIARNCALRILSQRKRVRTIASPDLDQVAFRVVKPPQLATDRERLLADLRRCIAALPSLQRRILQADLDAGDTVSAVALAAQFETSANSIYVSRQKGRKALLKSMKALGHDFGPPDDPHSHALAKQ